MNQTLQPDFIVELFRLALHDKHIQNIVIGSIKPNWLATKQEQKFLIELKFQVEVDKKKPNLSTIKQSFRNNKLTRDDIALNEFIEQIDEAELRDPDTMIFTLEDYIKQAMFIEIYDKSADLYNKGNKRAAYSLMTAGAGKLETYSLTKDNFEPLFVGFTKRHTERMMARSTIVDYMPMGIDELDHLSGGGPCLGEFVLLLGESKGTKSFGLVHCGVNYARRGYKGVHIQAEGTDKQIKDRYDSNWSGSLYHEMKSGNIDDGELFKRYKNIVANIGDGEVFIYTSDKFDSLTMLEIRQKIINLKKKYDIKFVIIDYLDLINPDNDKYGPNDERFRQQKVARMMKDLARELNVLVISATQASSIPSELLQDEGFVIRREHLSENKAKIQPVDWLLTLNRTDDEAKNNILRIWMEALRDNRGGHVIKIKQNLKRSRFYDRQATLSSGFFES